VRAEAAYALGCIGGPAKDHLVALKAALKDSDETVRKAATDAIESLEGKEGEARPK